jgi:hypothetical protein
MDNIKMDVREIGWSGIDYIDLAQDRDTGISWQTEDRSFGDHLSSESVSVTSSSVMQASIVLCSVSS